MQAIYFAHDSINYLCATVINAVKKVSSLLIFNFIKFQFFPIYLYIYLIYIIAFTIPLISCVRLWQMLQKSFACGGLSSLLYFNCIKFQFSIYLYIYLRLIYCVHGSINYFCATVANAVKKFSLRQAFVAPVFQFH